MDDSGIAGGFILLAIILVIFIIVYFVPSIVANSRKHAQLNAIFWLNLLTGWSFIGWVASLVWALTNPAVVASQPTGRRDSYVASRSSQPSEKTCPRCAETIKSAALVCRYCGHEFPPEQANELPERKVLKTDQYRGIPYTEYVDYSITAIIGDDIRTFERGIEFYSFADAYIDRNRKLGH